MVRPVLVGAAHAPCAARLVFLRAAAPSGSKLRGERGKARRARSRAPKERMGLTLWARVLALERRCADDTTTEGGGLPAAPFCHLATKLNKIIKGERSMAGEVARWRANAAAERQHPHDLSAVRRRMERAEAEVMAVGHVTRGAVHENVLTSLVCDQAERMSPSGAELYRLQALAGAIEMTEAIRSVRSRW